jgi:serine protease Do
LKEDENTIKDVEWKDVECKQEHFTGGIKFRSKSKNLGFARISKGLVFILIAVFSGGIAGSYVAGEKYSQLETEKNNASVFQGNKISNDYTSTSENAIANVAGSVSQSVIEITSEGNDGNGYVSSGSGIIFKSDGYILTNYHIVSGDDKYFVKLSSSKTLPATMVGYDVVTDLAVLKVKAQNLPAATFGDSSNVQLGDYVVAVGNPQGNTTAGIVSSTNKKISNRDELTGASKTYGAIQTDAPINEGNSGGALCNLNGEVIGVNSLNINGRNKGAGVWFAVSINEAKSIISSILNKGHTARPYLGIQMEDYKANDKSKIKGVLVKDIILGTKAVKSGIEVNDIIVQFDGVKLYSTEELGEILENHKVGDSIPLKIIRAGKLTKCNITLSESPSN